MIDFTTTPIEATGASTGHSDGASAISLNAATIIVGSNTGANGNHAFLRFSTGAVIASGLNIVNCECVLNIETPSTPDDDFDLWASEFGTGVPTNADYNKSANNEYEGGATGTLRVRLGTIIAGGVLTVDDAAISYPVPSRFVRKGGAEVSDFEIRPTAAGVPSATYIATLHGPTASAAFRPRLTGYALTDAELTDQNEYRFMAIGDESFLAIGVEETPGTAVKPDVLIELLRTTLDGQGMNLFSNAVSRQRARPRKGAVGREGAGGDVEFELTPERWVVMLLGMLKLVQTTDNGLVNGIQTYEHVFRVAKSKEIKTFTGVVGRGPLMSVFPGLTVGSIDINVDQDQLVTSTVNFGGRSEYIYDEDAAGGEEAPNLLSTTAAYDSVENGLLSFVGAAFSADSIGAFGKCVRTCSISLGQGVFEKRGFTRQRSIISHYVGGFEVGISYTAYLENEVQLRRFLGVAGTDFPFAAEQSLQYQDLEFSFKGGLDLENQELRISIPKASYVSVTKPINGTGAIMLECSAIGVVDPTIDSNVEITLVNGQPATFFDELTDEITVLPEGR